MLASSNFVFNCNFRPLLNNLSSFFCFSDIDLVIYGAWAELPLRTIERELLGREIARPDDLKVLDRAAVSSCSSSKEGKRRQ
jgi:hypothetical protein